MNRWAERAMMKEIMKMNWQSIPINVPCNRKNRKCKWLHLSKFNKRNWRGLTTKKSADSFGPLRFDSVFMLSSSFFSFFIFFNIAIAFVIRMKKVNEYKSIFVNRFPNTFLSRSQKRKEKEIAEHKGTNEVKSVHQTRFYWISMQISFESVLFPIRIFSIEQKETNEKRQNCCLLFKSLNGNLIYIFRLRSIALVFCFCCLYKFGNGINSFHRFLWATPFSSASFFFAIEHPWFDVSVLFFSFDDS